ARRAAPRRAPAPARTGGSPRSAARVRAGAGASPRSSPVCRPVARSRVRPATTPRPGWARATAGRRRPRSRSHSTPSRPAGHAAGRACRRNRTLGLTAMSTAMGHVLAAVAWPYANGPRHIGHVSGFGVPSDVFSRYIPKAGHDVLMVSGTDEYGTATQVQADAEGGSPRELVDRYNRVILEDLQGLGLSYD